MDQPPTITFLTETGRGIGSGHLTRCLALAAGFEQKGFFCRLLVNGPCKKLAEGIPRGISLVSSSWFGAEHRPATIALLEQSGAVVFDSYLVSPSELLALSLHCHLPVYFDDHMLERYERGIVINSSVHAGSGQYCPHPELQYLLGPAYAPLRGPFWNRKPKVVPTNVHTVLVCFGGADGKGMTRRVLPSLAKEFPEIEFQVVLGSFSTDQRLADEIRLPNLKFHSSCTAQQMAHMMQGADLAVCSGGQILFELLCFGLPFVAVLTADNQFNHMQGFEKEGLIAKIIRHDEPDGVQQVMGRFAALLEFKERKNFHRRALQLIDGRGVQRIVDQVCRRMAGQTLWQNKTH